MSSIDESQNDLQQLIGSDYTLQWVVGHGGMSTVWLADDNVHHREVAIKVLRPEFSDNFEFLSRFRNEALASENITSDNVVATYDYREADHNGRTLCFIVMEYVRGESLADLLARKKSLPEELALDVLEQAAHGLSSIHRMGMVHRDIKPGNLMVTSNGQVKITDFGIAKAAAAVPLTRTGMVVGTAQYVSPEQAQGHDVQASSDVYSLGVVGYEMLAGKRPFSGDSSVSVAIAHINQAPPALPTTVSAPARELIGIALRKDPEARYANGNELALAVSAARMGKRPPQPKSAPLQRPAPAPSPTASTQALGEVAQPTTVMPASGHVPVQQPPQQRPPQPAPQPVQRRAPKPVPAPEPKKSGGFAAGCGVAFLVVGAAAALAYGASQGWFSGSSDPAPSTPTTVTVTEDNTQAPQAPTTQAPVPTPTLTQPVETQPEVVDTPTPEAPVDTTPAQTTPNSPGQGEGTNPGGGDGNAPGTSPNGDNGNTIEDQITEGIQDALDGLGIDTENNAPVVREGNQQ